MTTRTAKSQLVLTCVGGRAAGDAPTENTLPLGDGYLRARATGSGLRSQQCYAYEQATAAAGYGWMRLLRMAKRIRSLKLRKSILRMMWLRWLSTVRVRKTKKTGGVF